MNRWFLLLAVEAMMLDLLLSGCTAGSGGGRSGPVAADVDLGRASLPMSKIDPPIEKPKKPASFVPLSDRGVKQIAAAKRLVDEQRYTEASIELERALRYDPNHPEVHRALALLHWQAGNIERARTHAQRAIEGDPDAAAPHYVLGRCHAMAGEKAEALKAYRTAAACSDLEAESETATLAHYHLAQALGGEGYLEAALREFEAFERSAATAATSTTRLELAALLRSTRGMAGEERSKVFEKLGRFAEAAAALAPAVSAAPADVERGKRYARLLARAGRYTEALTAARSVPADDAEFVAFLSDLHQQAGHPGRVIDDLRARVEARPDDPLPVLNLSDALVRLKKPVDATKELQGFLERNGDAHAVRLKLLDVLTGRGEWSQVLSVCGEGIRRQPERAVEYEARLAPCAADALAVEAILRAGGEESEDFAGAYLRGWLAAKAGRMETAEALLRRSVERERTFTPSRAALAELYLETFRYDEALAMAARTDPDRAGDARLERILGRVHDRLDDIDRAEFHFRAATQLDRTDVESMYALAQLYRRSDRALQSQRQLRVLLEKDADHEAARELLALLYLKEGKADIAVQEIEELRRRSKSPTTIARCRTLLEGDLRRDAAARREVLLKAMEEGTPDALTWIAVAETYEEDQAGAAREAYLKALELDPENEEAGLGAVRSSQALLQFEEAAERLEQLLHQRPNRHEWRLSLIEVYSVIQDFEAALSLAQKGASTERLPPNRQRLYRVDMIEALNDLGRAEETIEHLRAWSLGDADQREWKLRLADALDDAKRSDEAVAVYADLVRADGKDRAARSNLIAALGRAKRHDRAAQFALDWLSDDPENDQWVWLLATAQANAEKLDDALELVKARLRRTANREGFQDFLITRLSIAKRHDECVKLIEALTDEVVSILRMLSEGGRRRPVEPPPPEAVIHRPNEPSSLESMQERLEELRSRLAMQLILSKRFRDAEQQITSWLEGTNDPQTRARYLLALAECQRAQGNELQAGEILDRTRVMVPTDPTLNNDVAYLWIDRGIKLDEAEPLIRYAVGRLPRQAAYLDTYGWLLYKRGEFAAAKKWLLRANHAREGKDPVIHDHLGDTVWHLGESAKALEHWREAVQLTNERDPEARVSDDERRVRTVTPQKIEEAEADRKPPVAPLGEAVKAK